MIATDLAHDDDLLDNADILDFTRQPTRRSMDPLKISKRVKFNTQKSEGYGDGRRSPNRAGVL